VRAHPSAALTQNNLSRGGAKERYKSALCIAETLETRGAVASAAAGGPRTL